MSWQRAAAWMVATRAHGKTDHSDALGVDFGPLLQVLHGADDVVGFVMTDAGKAPIAQPVRSKIEAQHVVAGSMEPQRQRQALAAASPDAVAQHHRWRRLLAGAAKNQPLMRTLSIDVNDTSSAAPSGGSSVPHIPRARAYWYTRNADTPPISAAAAPVTPSVAAVASNA